jgi:hypothetical protein
MFHVYSKRPSSAITEGFSILYIWRSTRQTGLEFLEQQAANGVPNSAICSAPGVKVEHVAIDWLHTWNHRMLFWQLDVRMYIVFTRHHDEFNGFAGKLLKPDC